ncbi:MAG: MerR family transcriptional regulator [Bacteroidales bacterium]|nr:MerR family transcriptional regulator [Bacteroidales bacterium]MBP5522414.1 MerR family transcriptional regulator [Bacteroidales bacterium]
MEKLYYSISEAAGFIGESVSLVRFWTNSFPNLIKPRRNAKGNRQYTKDDIETLKQIHFLVKDKGLTLEGAAKSLAASNASVSNSVKALDSLKSIRAQLMEIKNSI